MLAAHGPSLCSGFAVRSVASSRLIRDIQASSSSPVRAFGKGKDPITPSLQAARTRSGPETRNIGATISGSFIWRFSF